MTAKTLGTENTKKLNTIVNVLDTDYHSVDEFLEKFKPLPLQLYTRGESPSQERIEKLANSLKINDKQVVVLEAINWIQLTAEKIEEWNLKNVEPGKYLINGNTRYLALKYLKENSEGVVFNDIILQEIGIEKSSQGDLFDLQDYFNDETVAHSRYQKIKALASLIISLKKQGIKDNEISKVCESRKGVTATDVKTARNFFIVDKYKKEELDFILALVKTDVMAFDTAVTIMDYVNNPKNQSTAKGVIELIRLHNDLSDTDTITRAMFLALKEFKNYPKANGIKASKTNVDDNGSNVLPSKNPDDDEEVITSPNQKVDKAELIDIINSTVEMLTQELSSINSQDVDEELKLNYRDALPSLQNVFNSLVQFVPLEDSIMVFSIIGQMVQDASKKQNELTDDQLTSVAKTMKKFYNTLN